jgi:hypothetical protein
MIQPRLFSNWSCSGVNVPSRGTMAIHIVAFVTNLLADVLLE